MADERNEEKTRRCLRCDKEFTSRGIGNRICKKCTSSNADERLPKSVPNFLSYLDNEHNWSEDENI